VRLVPWSTGSGEAVLTMLTKACVGETTVVLTVAVVVGGIGVADRAGNVRRVGDGGAGSGRRIHFDHKGEIDGSAGVEALTGIECAREGASAADKNVVTSPTGRSRKSGGESRIGGDGVGERDGGGTADGNGSGSVVGGRLGVGDVVALEELKGQKDRRRPAGTNRYKSEWTDDRLRKFVFRPSPTARIGTRLRRT